MPVACASCFLDNCSEKHKSLMLFCLYRPFSGCLRESEPENSKFTQQYLHGSNTTVYIRTMKLAFGSDSLNQPESLYLWRGSQVLLYIEHSLSHVFQLVIHIARIAHATPTFAGNFYKVGVSRKEIM